MVGVMLCADGSQADGEDWLAVLAFVDSCVQWHACGAEQAQLGT